MSQSKENLFDAVLFDLDGTLIEFKFRVVEAKQAIIQRLEEKEFFTGSITTDMKTQEIMDEIQKIWESSESMRSKFTFESVKQEISDVLGEFEYDGFNRAKPYPGSFWTLKELEKMKIKTAIVTNSGRGPVDYVLGKLGFLPLVSLVITRNEMRRMKPDPDGLLRAIQFLKVSNERTAYVGDSVIDVVAAKKAGIKSIALASGMYEESQLKAMNPDFIVRAIEELPRIVTGP